MNRSHPTLENWLDWIHERMPQPSSSELETHLGRCRSCSDSLPMLRRLRSANRLASWKRPPRSVLRQACQLRPMPSPPPQPARFYDMQWRPSDVRGTTLVAAAEPGSLNAVLKSAEISIAATPPRQDPFWEIEGRVWLRNDDSKDVDIVLLQEDHVIAHKQVASAEFFRMREVLPSGWELEVHLPDKNSVRLAERAH